MPPTTRSAQTLVLAKKPWENMCCMARCRREQAEQVTVRFGGQRRVVAMCAEHAEAYQLLART